MLENSLSVVIPVYNSENTLDELLGRLAQTLPLLTPVYEVILVNDGSHDRSWEIIYNLTQTYSWARGINLMRNYGQHNALLCGVRLARAEVIVTMDDDLQHPPEEIHKLIEKLEQGFDVVYGIPQKRPHTWWRNILTMIIRRALALAMGVKNIRDFASFRAFRAHLRGAFENYQNPNVILDVLLSWGTARFATVTVDEKPRAVGRFADDCRV